MKRETVTSLLECPDETAQQRMAQMAVPFDEEALFRRSFAQYRGETLPLPSRRSRLVPFTRAGAIAACLLLTLGLVRHVWSRQQKPETRPLPAATTTTTTTTAQTETVPSTASRTDTTVSASGTLPATLPETAPAVTTALPATTFAPSGVFPAVPLPADTPITTVPDVPAATFPPVTAAPPETTAATPAAGTTGTTAPPPSTTTGTETVPATGTTTVTTTFPPEPIEEDEDDRLSDIFRSSGFLITRLPVEYASSESFLIRAVPEDDDPTDFSLSYTLTSDTVTLLSMHTDVRDGLPCRVLQFYSSRPELRCTFDVVQYLRKDFRYFYTNDPTHWAFSWGAHGFQIAEGNYRNVTAVVWDDGNYIMCSDTKEEDLLFYFAPDA